jgi:hypothetical protein
MSDILTKGRLRELATSGVTLPAIGCTGANGSGTQGLPRRGTTMLPAKPPRPLKAAAFLSLSAHAGCNTAPAWD